MTLDFWNVLGLLLVGFAFGYWRGTVDTTEWMQTFMGPWRQLRSRIIPAGNADGED